MASKAVASPPPAEWPAVVLDSQGLWAIANNDSEDVRAVVASSKAGRVRLFVPTAVLAETLRGNQNDAPLNQVVKKIDVVELTEKLARDAAKLKASAGLSGVAATIDAIVVATSAEAGGGLVITSDPGDMRTLANQVVGVTIKVLSV
jgi:predicted nucleic acid-binding protein